MRSIGLDVSTKTGMAITGDGDDRGKVVTPPGVKGFHRVQLIASEVERTLVAWQPDLVLIERVAFCRNVDAFVVLVEVNTAIKIMLHNLKIQWFEVTPPTLKKWVTGKGNAKKEHMAEAAKKRWSFSSWSNDIVDALCLAKMGQLGVPELLQIPGVEHCG